MSNKALNKVRGLLGDGDPSSTSEAVGIANAVHQDHPEVMRYVVDHLLSRPGKLTLNWTEGPYCSMCGTRGKILANSEDHWLATDGEKAMCPICSYGPGSPARYISDVMNSSFTDEFVAFEDDFNTASVTCRRCIDCGDWVRGGPTRCDDCVSDL